MDIEANSKYNGVIDVILASAGAYHNLEQNDKSVEATSDKSLSSLAFFVPKMAFDELQNRRVSDEMH